jgi:hypothetical protein
MTPLEVLTGAKPNLANLQIWGSRVWVHDMEVDRSWMEGQRRAGG